MLAVHVTGCSCSCRFKKISQRTESEDSYRSLVDGHRISSMVEKRRLQRLFDDRLRISFCIDARLLTVQLIRQPRQHRTVICALMEAGPGISTMSASVVDGLLLSSTVSDSCMFCLQASVGWLVVFHHRTPRFSGKNHQQRPNVHRSSSATITNVRSFPTCAYLHPSHNIDCPVIVHASTNGSPPMKDIAAIVVAGQEPQNDSLNCSFSDYL